jgi:histidine triad (HIT) family protein
MACLFCDIAAGVIPADIVLNEPDVIALRDRNPQAPTHFLIIPKQHIATINDVMHADQQLMGRLVMVAQSLAVAEGIAESGYRLLFNVNAAGGQTVYHIHLHLLGGRVMHWPPG